MLPNLDEYPKRAYSYILQAEKLYVNWDEAEETTPEKLCRHALQLLEGIEDGFVKSILACEANVWLFLSTVKRLRLLHVELDPLNGSDDLFAPVPPRDAFEPKPLENLSPASFRDGFERMNEVHEEAYRIWLDGIKAAYYTLKSAAEKRAAISVTNKLASISLLSAHPFCSLELYHCLWQWSKCATGLRWFTSLLITFGFPSTAAKHFSSPAAATAMSNPQSEKYGTQAMMEQTLRLASICSKETSVATAKNEPANRNSQFTSSVRHRLESLSSFVDCFAIQQDISDSSAKGSLVSTITRSRQCAGHIFMSNNKMDTCTTITSLDNCQNFIDIFWYLQALLNDALIHQRCGKSDRSLGLLMEGFSISFVLCSPYWLMKFTTHLAQLHALFRTDDAEVLERLLFIRDVFSPDVPKLEPHTPIRGASMNAASADPDATPLRTINWTPAPAELSAVELARLAASGRRASPLRNLEFGSDGIQRIEPSVKSERSRSISSFTVDSPFCRCCDGTTTLNEAIFMAVTPLNPSSPQYDGRITRKCFEILRVHLDSKRTKRCSTHSAIAPMSLNDKELSACINDPLWNLLDFYLLMSWVDGTATNKTEEQVALVQTAIDTVSSASPTLFSLYYRLTFSLSLVQWKLSKYGVSHSRADIVDQLSKLQLDEQKENAPKRRRPKKAKTPGKTAAPASEEKTAINSIAADVQKYGRLQFYPWYRWARQLIALMHLPSAPADLRLESIDWSAMSASNFVETSSISFRHSVTARESATTGDVAAKLCLFPDDTSFKDALSNLPLDWTVISLHLVRTVTGQRLVMCRLSGRCRPIVMDLDDVISKFDAVSAFSSFYQEIDESIKVTEKKRYWARRTALEKKLAAVLKQLETDWFGCHRALLSGYSPDKKEALVRSESLKDPYVLEVLLAAVGILDDSEKTQYLTEILSLSDDGQLKRYLNALQMSFGSATLGPVFLILDKELHGIPWENMQLLRNQPVCRMPCLQYLMRSVSAFRPPKEIASDRVYYIVNPSRDLPSTEEFFKWFSSIKHWSGTYGTQPSLDTMKEALASKDLYIYCGHNSGVKCLNSSRRIEQLSCNAAVVLMGCGSAKAIGRGPLYEPDTVPFHYLVADSPCVVGCLWSVTAPDIDKYLARVLSLWLKAVPHSTATTASSSKVENASHITSLLCALAQAKSACKLPLLTGGAVVSFGIPVFCDKPLSS